MSVHVIYFVVGITLFAMAIRGIYDRLDKIICLLASRKEQS